MEAHAFLVVILIIFLATLLQIIWNSGILSMIKKRKLPPGPNGLPIIGSLLSINGDSTHQSLFNLARIYGPLMTLKLGFVNVVVASSAEMAKQILQKHEREFIGRPIPDAATSYEGYELALPWLPVGPHWKKLRKICNAHFLTPHKLDYSPAQESRHRVMGKMMDRVAEASDAGEAVRIERVALGAVVRLLSNSMFSDDVEELQVLLGGDLMVLLGKPNVGDYFPFLRPFDLHGIRRGTGRFYGRMHELIDGVIDARMDRRGFGSDRVGDFLDVLLDYMEDDGSERLARLDVRLMIMELFIGGTDSSTTTVEWAMTELLRNPTILSKLKQQLSDKIPPRKTLQEQDIAQLPYLTAVIKETMRVHPPSALLLPRLAEQDVEIQGFHIPKNTRIWLNVLSITRDASCWDRPTCFVPERFLDSDVDFRGVRNFSFIPFSSGRRICPGMNLGVRMVSLILGSLVHEFEWKLPDGMAPHDMDMTERFGVTLRKAEPLKAIPIRVKSGL